MALDGIGNATAIAQAVLRQLGDVPIPVQIEEIAAASGISEIKRAETKGFEGALIAPDHKATGVILVNTRSRSERQRFTIGHELGHFLNPWHKPPEGGFRCTKADMFAREDGGKVRIKMEIEANEFSAEMLMPKARFTADLRKLVSPGLEHVVQLAARYQTSKLATARRFVDLYDDAAAVVLTRNGIVEQLHRTKNFPFISVACGQAVHGRSATSRVDAGEGRCSDTETVEPALWTENPLRLNAEMYEQVLVQSDGYRITLLSVDESQCEDDDGEYASGRADWQPGF
jgi:Zn-dependent peptidase ImmA (M78 family)